MIPERNIHICGKDIRMIYCAATENGYYYSDGRYGPYISSNRVNVSVKEQPSLEAAIDLINNKKTAIKKIEEKTR